MPGGAGNTSINRQDGFALTDSLDRQLDMDMSPDIFDDYSTATATAAAAAGLPVAFYHHH